MYTNESREEFLFKNISHSNYSYFEITISVLKVKKKKTV